jgi:hypothetical protein
MHSQRKQRQTLPILKPQQAMPLQMPGPVDMHTNLLQQFYNGMPPSLQGGVTTATANPLGGLGDWSSRAVAAGAAAAASNRMMVQPGFGNFMPGNTDFSSSVSSAAAQGQGAASLDSAFSLSRVPSTGMLAKSMGAATGAALSAGDAEQAHASAIASWASGAAGVGSATMADKLRLMTPKDQLGLITVAQMAQLDDGRNQPLELINSQPVVNSFGSCLKASVAASAPATLAASAVGAGNLASRLTASKLDGQGAGGSDNNSNNNNNNNNNNSVGGVSVLSGGGEAPSNVAAAAAAAAGGRNQTMDPSLLTPELLGMYAQLLIQQQEQERQRWD